MKAQEIRELSSKERKEKITDLRQEYFNLKFQLAIGKIENPGRLNFLRRDVARIKTIQKEAGDGKVEAKQDSGESKEAKK